MPCRAPIAIIALTACIVLAEIASAWAGTTTAPAAACAPVEVAPGVKQVPRGCSVVSTARPRARSDGLERSDRPSGPKTIRIGNTEITVSGRVRAEYGIGR